MPWGNSCTASVWYLVFSQEKHHVLQSDNSPPGISHAGNTWCSRNLGNKTTSIIIIMIGIFIQDIFIFLKYNSSTTHPNTHTHTHTHLYHTHARTHTHTHTPLSHTRTHTHTHHPHTRYTHHVSYVLYTYQISHLMSSKFLHQQSTLRVRVFGITKHIPGEMNIVTSYTQVTTTKVCSSHHALYLLLKHALRGRLRGHLNECSSCGKSEYWRNAHCKHWQTKTETASTSEWWVTASDLDAGTHLHTQLEW